ncbi:MAG: glycerol-3-phosphate dehydrogenase/oxidase [Anaerolineae bacterium]|jgi:glycerol-3-phosphate dehydrogenase|nr:glycerol-3-phosphate dehydrogenase/oxidase [Anaerolineae bacterium]
MNRMETLQYFRENPKVSVLIIGGGVNGIGVFRDLGLQGVDVLLAERNDFSSGTSAASSRMVHGGLRYLEVGDFELVRESVQERNWLLEYAPHAVRLQPSAIPIYSRFSGLLNAPLKFLNLLHKPSERGAIIAKIGLALYDLYTGKKRTVPKHKMLNRSESLKLFPNINPDIINIATYYDAQMSLAERICVEMIIDAEEINPKALALNYLPIVDRQGNGIILQDEVTKEKLVIYPKVVINAAGPWIDHVNATLGETTNYVKGTKGSHIIIDNPDLFKTIKKYLLFFENKDGRFVMMCRLGERVLVGSTDIYSSDPDQVTCTSEEKDYFLNMVRLVFPKIQIASEEIVFRFSGVRPLPNIQARQTGQITRNHRIETIDASPEKLYSILSLVGGKWTTFRAFAEEATNQILALLEIQRKSESRTYPIGGSKNYPKNSEKTNLWIEELYQKTSIKKVVLNKWFERYGTRAAVVASFTSEYGNRQWLQTLPDYTISEILFIIKNEKVLHLDDFLLRRSLIAMEGKISLPLVQELSHVFAKALGWDEKQRMAETERLSKILATKHQVIL